MASFLTIKCPSGNSYDLSVQTLLDHLNKGNEGVPVTEASLLSVLPSMPLQEILVGAASSLRCFDVEAWNNRPEGASIPQGFVLRIIPQDQRPDGCGSPSRRAFMIHALQRAKISGNPFYLLDQVIAELQKEDDPKCTQSEGAPVKADGWGHTSHNATTEDLLREGAAAAEGTDRHEQVFRELLGENNEKAALGMLFQAYQELHEQFDAFKTLTNRRHVRYSRWIDQLQEAVNAPAGSVRIIRL